MTKLAALITTGDSNGLDRYNSILRWNVLPFVIFATWIAAVFITLVFAAVLDIDWREPFVGFVVAFAVIWVAWRVAPSHKLIVGLCVLSLGGWTAWQMLEPSMYPESYPKAYQPTHIPFAATVAGGMIALTTRWVLAASAKVLRTKVPAATEKDEPASSTQTR